MALLVVPALVVFAVAWISITQSRADSMALLDSQGRSFTAALARASENAIMAESHYDRLVRQRYFDIATSLGELELSTITELDLLRFMQVHDLFGVYLFGMDSNLVGGTSGRGVSGQLPDFVLSEMKGLIANPELRFILLLDQDPETGEAVHYYMELTNQLDRVVLLVTDAGYYVQAEDGIGIGFLAQKMALEPGVEYIMYQDPEGIIIASGELGEVLAIESEPFLQTALDGDSVASRVTEFQGKQILEIVQPFATREYPYGLFRVGLSLDKFYSISRGFDIQMLLISGFLSILLVLAVFYVNSREKRKEISRRYSRIKSVTDRIFEQMHTGVAVISPDNRIRMCNQSFELMLGATGAEGKRIDQLINSDQLDLNELRSQAPRAVDDIEFSLKRNHDEHHLLAAASFLSTESDDSPDTVLVLYDITRLRAAEKAVARKERLSEMGDLAAGVAHEIRNPLNTISIAIQRLASEFAPHESEGGDEFLSFTEKIRGETRRLNDIITRFLALARHSESKKQAIQLDELIDETLSLLKPEAESLAIELSWSTQRCQLTADPGEIKQVIHNLFSNSKEALDGQPGRINLIQTCDATTVTITFSDDGPGFDGRPDGELFTPYFTTKESGTGLGLATVHRIVSSLSGEITTGPSNLGGALVTITLPLS